MKQWAKGLFKNFKLSHISWMIVGVFLTEFITWVLYKTPKKITAPGFSAIVAACALSLAVYSAYQLTKWIKSKVNDKGFKKCEAIIDKIQEIAVEAVKINIIIEELFITKKVIINESIYNKTIEKLNIEKEKLREVMLEMHAHELHLQIWGFEISTNYSLKEFNDILIKYISSINKTIKNSKQLLLIGEYKEVGKDREQYKEALRRVSDYMDTINGSSFDEIFVPFGKK
ncbi:hypothetical protein GXP72_07065 [Enterobacter sp. SES19]|uniref:hypothetical protein n=1 Tax=Enterobacter TaxID=547 RepID=UPI0008E33DDA|nr:MULTISPECIES: hypothetical protein [unclassified Enterobacter]KAE8275691.1 hypothetical protein DOU50_06305 [Enterobacter sp. C6]QIR22183.1 hypothetical protein GXP72_07065 [Enterobacter sp. SES19]SFH97166.1 hypothetical protein SAMN03159336_1489 [Enterobacter sp. NFIX59]